MNWLEFIFIVITGFTASAEFGSFAFVHPVVKRLPPKHHIMVEKGLVGTFGVLLMFRETLLLLSGMLTTCLATGNDKEIYGKFFKEFAQRYCLSGFCYL